MGCLSTLLKHHAPAQVLVTVSGCNSRAVVNTAVASWWPKWDTLSKQNNLWWTRTTSDDAVPHKHAQDAPPLKSPQSLQ